MVSESSFDLVNAGRTDQARVEEERRRRLQAFASQIAPGATVRDPALFEGFIRDKAREFQQRQQPRPAVAQPQPAQQIQPPGVQRQGFGFDDIGRGIGAIGRGALGAGRFLGEQLGPQDRSPASSGSPFNNVLNAPREPASSSPAMELLKAYETIAGIVETGQGVLVGGAQALVPGEQEFERNKRLAQLKDPDGANLTAGLRSSRQAFQETDLPSGRLDLIPGKGINLPGDRTLNEVQFGVKGAIQEFTDPANLIPGAVVAKPLGIAGRAVGRGVNAALPEGATVRRALDVLPVAGARAAGPEDVIPGGQQENLVSGLRASNEANDQIQDVIDRDFAAFQKRIGLEDAKTERDLRNISQAVPDTRVGEAIRPDTPSQIRGEFGQEITPPGTSEVIRAKSIQRTGAEFEVRESANKLHLHMSRIRELSDVNREAIVARRKRAAAEGYSRADKLTDPQAQTGVELAALRGSQTPPPRFEPLARRVDPDNPKSRVIELGTRDQPLNNNDIRVLNAQIRFHFRNQQQGMTGTNASAAFMDMLTGTLPEPKQITNIETALGISLDALRTSSRDNLDRTLDAIAIPKTLRSAIDMSGLLRQAGIYTINFKNLSPTVTGRARRKTIRESVKVMVKAYVSKNPRQLEKEVFDEIVNRNPVLYEALTTGGQRLHLSTPGAALSGREEAFLSTFFDKAANIDLKKHKVFLPIKFGAKSVGQLVVRSDVSFSAMLNRMRFDSIEQLVNDAARVNGIETVARRTSSLNEVVEREMLDGLTTWTNAAFGRGRLPGFKDNITARILNGVFWAPRLATARAETLIRGPVNTAREIARLGSQATGVDVGLRLRKQPFQVGLSRPAVPDVLGRNLTPAQLVRRRTAEEFVGFLSAGATILGMGKLAHDAGIPGFEDFEVELDPRSSDFGKGKFGTTRFDFWGGHQQFIRHLAQVATGERKVLSTGKINKTNVGATGVSFVRSKLAPGLPTLGTGELFRSSFLGEPLSNPAPIFGTERVSNSQDQLGFVEQFGDAATGGGSVRTRETAQQLTPLTAMEYLDVMRERGLMEGAVFSLPPFFGAGAQTFGEPTTDETTTTTVPQPQQRTPIPVRTNPIQRR